MSNDKTTLADAQPGGRVRLGDSRSLAERITDHLCDNEYDIGGRAELFACVNAALSAQPSPAGQDALEDEARRMFEAQADPLAAPWSRQWEPTKDHWRKAALAARQPVGEPITVEAVATVRRWSNGERYIDWLTEGGIADLEVGDVLMVSDRAITDEDGSGEIYAAPPAQAVDLGQLPDGWLLSKKATCYQLSHGNDIVGNLVGPDAEENAAIIARVLDSQAVGNG